MHGTSAAARQWRNVPLVRDHDARRTRRLAGLLLGMVGAAIPLIFYLLQQIDYVHVRYQIEELRTQHDRLVEAERRLRMERATLQALPSVEARALHDLQLVHALPENVVVQELQPRRGNLSVLAPDELHRAR